ncbi:MAG TPA: NADH:ubiquinone reductase (Na(+)-transporting) subunit C [Tenuifilaceae bacterium]|jgi:Na+-transporting NADH:ubiquinone oxidoreductase subunit C|nr:NADH:ubiquinone reductase (Na(+)-transporting) subunit C [Tenuifilaceae bacterium]HPS05014.1 NADH:ubiquinone reductase (Na(+)-transporting) subunit C [Tenuifilaceae bacterium]HPW26178.1 NADH:ubiquinone reductase (Na(+)-transporting) subunit C [Tenuifilaceae bacterium]HQM04373.1 NADH:ubiquinone reductase (Na(+)-transporting) subunit C [Tenuifilaceae bacterium]HQN82926.1 NADH:ubiquinone reductase (Na(+)-transporting) subunit C [Tenuifilaceae bacterium]
MSIFGKLKSMDKNSNLYTILYASGLVVLVAVLLALAATLLKPAQQRNVETEKKIDILKSIGKADGVEKAANKHKFVASNFERYIVEQLVVNSLGERIQGVDAFNVDLKVELSKPLENRYLPVFVAKLDSGSTKFIFPLRGKGLWGPIWGYISLNDDFNTIYGATFSHQGETPGLGAEIATPQFQKQFDGKSIFDNQNQLVSIKVVKGGADKSDPHGVDAVSGGTITSKGLEAMLYDCLSIYMPFINNQKQQSHE